MNNEQKTSINTLSNIKIEYLESDGIIIDFKIKGNTKMTSSWKIDLLFNTFQVILIFNHYSSSNIKKNSINVLFSEVVLTKKDEENIIQFLIGEMDAGRLFY